MGERAGNHQHEYKGTTVYCNADSVRKDGQSDDAAAREKAVRKMVRAIIEVRGGNGKEIKKSIDTDYKKGIVWWKNVRVADGWKDGQLVLTGAAADFRDAFAKLLGLE